jgi:hypothetical protein
MKHFIMKHSDLIAGVLSGFDKLVFRGSLRTLSYTDGMMLYLSRVSVLLKDFAGHMLSISGRIRENTVALAKARGIKVIYLDSSQEDKEAIARKIASDHRITEGLICILSVVEPCRSYKIRRDPETRKLHLESCWRKCLFYYHYLIHPIFGFMSARIQTWMPLPIQVCINGREWLSRQLDAAGLRYVRRDNSFIWLKDSHRTQQLFDQQLKVAWPKLLNDIALYLNPAHKDMFKQFPISYYWCVYQSEWATDVLFRSADELGRLYPRFVHHGLSSFASPDVMRFLGHKVPKQGYVNGNFQGEIISSLKRRPEGVRIKHWVNHNSIKLYDKQGSVLRVETTINDSRDLKVYRRKEGQRGGGKSWQRMRKSIADLPRRAHLSQAANERYLDALAAVSDDATLSELTKDICRPVMYQGKRFRSLRLWEPNDLKLFETVTKGEFLITGFRNRDIAQILFPEACASACDKKKISAAVSYRLRILRAHGIIAKTQHTNRYRLTTKGRRIITAVLAAHRATTAQLTQEVA